MPSGRRVADWERVVARGRYGGVGRHSGAQVTAGGGVTGPASSGVYELRGGRSHPSPTAVRHARRGTRSRRAVGVGDTACPSGRSRARGGARDELASDVPPVAAGRVLDVVEVDEVDAELGRDPADRVDLAGGPARVQRQRLDPCVLGAHPVLVQLDRSPEADDPDHAAVVDRGEVLVRLVVRVDAAGAPAVRRAVARRGGAWRVRVR